MARLPRPHFPALRFCFLGDDDRQNYLRCLLDALVHFGCRLHAYVLMANHVHLLLIPGEVGAVSRLQHIRVSRLV